MMGSLRMLVPLVLVLGGCGAAASQTPATSPSPPPSQPQPNPQPGFLARAANGALFLQWTRSGDSVTGSVAASYTKDSDPTQVVPGTGTFTGTIGGSSVTLTFSEGDFGTTWNGTYDGTNLTLSFPASDGTLSTQYFKPSTIAAYNAAVLAVQSRASSAATATAVSRAAVEAQSAATQTAVANAPLYAVLAEAPDYPGAVPIHRMRSSRTDWASLAIEGGSALRGCLTAVHIDVAQQQPDGSLRHVKTYNDSDVCAAPYRSDYFLPTDQNGDAKPGQYQLLITVGNYSIAPYMLAVLAS